MDEQCWFCDENQSTPSVSAIVEMASDVKRCADRTIWNPQSVAVPRCVSCYLIHKQVVKMRKVAMAGVLAAIALYVALEGGVGEGAVGLLFLALMAVGLTGWLTGLLCRVTVASHIKPASEARWHPVVAERIKQDGWELGSPKTGAWAMVKTAWGGDVN